MKRLAWSLVWAHGIVLALALFGLMSAVPNPAQFAGNTLAMSFFGWAIVNVGTIDIWTGALAMIAYGIAAVGPLRTFWFFIAATAISATAELTGTATGWPFGGYEYLSFLGLKLAGRVPYTVPLSWFYMGFASFLLASFAIDRFAPRNRTILTIVLGAWLLTAWDLVLDPAMASDKMNVMHFWVWKEHGPYFGMPLRNLVGWFGTGLVFIAVGGGFWKSYTTKASAGAVVPFAVYAINVVWAMVLSVSVGLWQTAVAAILLSLVPAIYAYTSAKARTPLSA
jgi:putative membrane protein